MHLIMMNLMKRFAFGTIGILLILMIAATLLEKMYGTDFAINHIYHSWYFVLLWVIAGGSGLVYIFHRRLQRKPVALLIHLSLALILAGALTSFLTSRQGNIHLRTEEDSLDRFITKNGKAETLPFRIKLKGFRIDYYPGTTAPMDYISELNVIDGTSRHEGVVSMNNIYEYRNYRFYQSAYDPDGKGTLLSVSYDPYGIGITYTGYILLGLSLILYFFLPKTGFRALLAHPLLRKGSMLCFFLIAAPTLLQGKDVPRTVSREVADSFDNLYIYYNDRICPLQTLSHDFTMKLYGKPSYKGLTAGQVLLGWVFYYEHWKQEPVIRIKSQAARQILGIENKYARLTDFADLNGFKLERILQTQQSPANRKALEEANEKFNLVSMIATGSMLKIYPFQCKDDKQPTWYSFNDKLPAEIPTEQWMFVRRSMDLVAEQIAHGKDCEAIEILEKIRKYQQKEAQAILPTDQRFEAEKIYNRFHYTGPVAMFCVTLGILGFIYYGRRTAQASEDTGNGRTINRIQLGIMALIGLYLLLTISLRGYVSNHLPLSNGYETMQFMAFCTIILTFLFQRKFKPIISFGFLLCGLSLLVSMFGESNPPVTNLMPVLASPLLSIHVVFIMLAYSLLAFMMLNGIMAISLHYTGSNKKQIERLYIISRILTYPAVACLTIGIFVGAIWANVSWGNYWGWDPKEVWALITMLVYSTALHPSSLPAFQRPMFFHWFAIFAFLCVLVTYFGVNFFMGGMHSYA